MLSTEGFSFFTFKKLDWVYYRTQLIMKCPQGWLSTRARNKSPLSALTGARIKRGEFGENVSAFPRDKNNCP